MYLNKHNNSFKPFVTTVKVNISKWITLHLQEKNLFKQYKGVLKNYNSYNNRKMRPKIKKKNT